MRLSEITAALLVAPLLAAHGGIAGGPKIFGLPPNDAAALRSRNVYSRHAVRAAKFAQDSKLQTRQGGADGRCGKEFGCASCAEGYCCSSAGYCGKGQDYCQAPDSQADYGPGADANKAPLGGTTRNIARPKVGTVPYGGEGIYACNTPGTVAITYDDGPYIYTNDVLDQFAAYGAKATFFVTGININKGAIDEVPAWNAVIKRMYAEGHQVASHTWSHQDLSAITKEQRYEQMVKLEMSLSNILGFFPTYMRPPYSSCTTTSGCAKDMEDLGYHISYFDLDTDDYNNITPDLIQNAKNNYANAINPSNPATEDFLAIAHDIHQQTAQNLTGYMLDLLTAKGYRAVTMGECMGDPKANWYRDGTGRVASTSAFTPPSCASTRASSASGSRTSSAAGATPTAVSQDSSCGPAAGFTCLGFSEGECCSQYGWCGNTEGHCGTGCQAGFGKCGLASSSLSSSVASTSSRATSSSASKSSSASSTKASSSSSASSTKASSSSTKASISSSASSTKASSSSSVSSTKASSSSSASSTKTSSSSAVSSTKVSSTISVSSTKISSSSSIAASTSKSSSSVPSSSSSSSKASSSALASSSSTKASSAIPSTSSRAASSSSAPSSTPSRATSTDGKCGGTKGLTCLGFAEGECCSKNNWCGNTAAHCGTGCNPLFGKCTGTGSSSVPVASSSIKIASSAPAVASPSTVKSASASSVNQPASSTPKASSTVATSIRASSTSSSKPTGVISPNGSCGPSKGYNCIGYYEGECCSQYGYCGSSTAHCGAKCQPLYGKCN